MAVLNKLCICHHLDLTCELVGLNPADGHVLDSSRTFPDMILTIQRKIKPKFDHCANMGTEPLYTSTTTFLHLG